MAITGNGNSSKEQVAKNVEKYAKNKRTPKNLDSTDGPGCRSMSFFNFQKNEKQKKKYSGWSSFIDKNPDKIA